MVGRSRCLFLICSCAPLCSAALEGVALVQASALVQAEHGPEKRRSALDRVDCEERPALCRPPFSCERWDNRLRVPAFALFGIGSNGHANLHSWCMSPQYEKYIAACLVEKDLVKAAQVQFEATEAGEFGDGVATLDGSYCFLEGHCTNTAVSNGTTLEDAEEMCDYRYGGRQGWTSFGQVNPSNIQQFRQILVGKGKNQDAKTKGFRHRAITQFYAKAACAMGNFHCDVMYCKETYCKDPRYVERFKHLLPSLPGHLIQDGKDAKQEEPSPPNGL